MTEQESLEQRAAYGLPYQQPCNCISCSTTRKALAAGEAERQRLEEQVTGYQRIAAEMVARAGQRLTAQERAEERVKELEYEFRVVRRCLADLMPRQVNDPLQGDYEPRGFALATIDEALAQKATGEQP